jgi:uncharacterized membrane-anchored protein YhcB (DUF1043 family)
MQAKITIFQNKVSDQSDWPNHGELKKNREFSYKISTLKDDIERVRNELSKVSIEISEEINKKCDHSLLKNIEKDFNDRFQDLATMFSQKLADKGDVKKALKLLEKQIKSIY